MSHSVYKLTQDAVLESFDDGALILYLKDVSLIELNETGRDILSLTNGTNTMQAVAEQLATDYEIDLEDALQDISELYLQLAAQGILIRMQSPNQKGD